MKNIDSNINQPLKSSCLVCHKSTKKLFKKVGESSYFRCKKCDGIFVDPVQSQEFYLSNETYLDNPQSYVSRIDLYGQRWMIEQFDRLYQQKIHGTDKGKFLEIGAGVGFLSLFALARGWDVKAIETSATAVKYGKEYLKLDIEVATIEEYKTEQKFDAIVMVEVLEHFVDPMKAIEAIRRFCGPHTLLFGTTPNTDSEHWDKTEQNIYEPNDHIFLFNEKSIRNFAKKAGINDLTVEYFGSGEKHDSNLMFAGIISV